MTITQEKQDVPLRPPPRDIHQPTPRRSGTFALTPLSASSDDLSSSHAPSPKQSSELEPSSTASSYFSSPTSALGSAQGTPSGSMLRSNPSEGSLTQKTRSIINLTSSTLFGIYSPNDYDANRDEVSTPSGTGAQTPHKNGTFDFKGGRLPAPEVIEKQRQQRFSQQDQIRTVRRMSESQHRRPVPHSHRIARMGWRVIALFCVGMAYGEFITRLHDTHEIAPVQVDGISRRTWGYVLSWGLGAVFMGNILPWMDHRWVALTSAEHSAVPTDENGKDEGGSGAQQDRGSLGADWNPIVRTIGAFVGIAFAIRRLPWQSTLQVSLTLTLVNPVIWYLIDRSRTGFVLSTAVGLCGAAMILGINPDIVPSPASTASQPHVVVGGFSYESVGVATWISSVLFCSCVCFGNLGRRLSRSQQASLQ